MNSTKVTKLIDCCENNYEQQGKNVSDTYKLITDKRENTCSGRCSIRLLLRSLQIKWKFILLERENEKGKTGHEY